MHNSFGLVISLLAALQLASCSKRTSEETSSSSSASVPIKEVLKSVPNQIELERILASRQDQIVAVRVTLNRENLISINFSDEAVVGLIDGLAKLDDAAVIDVDPLPRTKRNRVWRIEIIEQESEGENSYEQFVHVLNLDDNRSTQFLYSSLLDECKSVEEQIGTKR